NATAVSEIDQLDRLFSSLYRKLLVTHSGAIVSIADLSAKRAPVRVEIQRRLALAQEYIAANLREPLDIGSIAAIASMSKHHFIRSFRQAYKITPYRLIHELRLRAARAELERGEASVTSVARQYRFSSIQTFSKAFKQFFGVAPSTIIPHHDNQI
ncbi:MAG TPA: helix-turn-helix transcriptional regulator, partial [Candidatus Kapabacteria bacterium]|nr:helix-turn-helix transcriptional regulator [Candidatus Kapabacteria bacterium]